MTQSLPANTDAPFVAGRMTRVSLLLCIFVAGVGNSFVFAILPPIGRDMGFTEVRIGLIITCSAAMFMLAAPPWGAWSERVGRRPVLLIALSGFFVTTVAFAFVVQLRLKDAIGLDAAYGWLVALRVLFAVFVSGVFPASQAYMADITPLQKRTAGMSQIGIAMGLGMISGPAIAAAFSGIGLIVPFYAVAFLALPVAAMVVRWIAEVPRAHPNAGGDETPPVAWRRFVPFFFISSAIMTSLATLQTATGFYFQDVFDLDTADTARAVGVGLMCASFSSVFAQFFFVQRLGFAPKRLVRSGVPTALLGVFLLQATDQYVWMVAGLGLFGLGMGQIMPGTIASLSMLAGPHRQGRVAGVNTSAQGFGFIVGPMIGSGLYTIFPLLPYRVLLGVLAVLLVNVYLVARYPD